MKKKLLPLALALVLCLGLMPVTASAAQADLPDWYFLFAIFKNVDADTTDKDGKPTRAKYSMTQDEIDVIRGNAREFEEYMNSVGVMRAHVDVVEINTTITELDDYDGGGYLTSTLAEPLLKKNVDLDKYDHVTCVYSLNIRTSYLGRGGSSYENGTGHTGINALDREHCLKWFTSPGSDWPIGGHVHEFLHFMERMNKKWGAEFGLHDIRLKFYIANGQSDHAGRDCYTDIILNQAKGTAGTGVHPAAWQYPPHVLRTAAEWTVPSGVTAIGSWAFADSKTLTRITLPAGVTSIGGAAFQSCTNLTSVSLPASMASVEQYTFANCPELTDVYYGGSEAQWKAIQISSTSNSALTRANIHYNSLMADVKTTDWFAKGVMWALEKGVTSGTGGVPLLPDSTCTQGQILTFLWRAYGSPAPTGAVSGSEYYAVPIQWAREQGVISGAVSPDAPCTRSDVVTYLWKLAGSPDAKTASFTDVPSSAGYARAVNWAVEQGVTSGTSAATFSPDSACTRGQIVTFLYRALS